MSLFVHVHASLHNAASVDECTQNLDNCDVNAMCIDLPQGFQCVCDSGFTGDGRTCTGVSIVISLIPNIVKFIEDHHTNITCGEFVNYTYSYYNISQLHYRDHGLC